MGSASTGLGCLREALVGVCGPQFTYHHLCKAADRDTTDIAGCTPLIMSWIYQMFLRFCPEQRDIIVFPLVSRFGGNLQLNRDNHERRMVQFRQALDRLGVHEFAWTPYDDQQWEALRPAWMLTDEEQMTWRTVVPIVCFMLPGCTT
ncbi:hypothetical protein PIB30_034192 [Stylosanthes scabra]|uniref:Aminotransferase-like plant mobile domain-containing protein n=1 Tax=Stylosanthes scabra TaxID=79078 RepID=A0ABU6RDI3_9FABA|nr:hypothetical protein [Stylosanthes scabra]